MSSYGTGSPLPTAAFLVPTKAIHRHRSPFRSLYYCIVAVVVYRKRVKLELNTLSTYYGHISTAKASLSHLLAAYCYQGFPFRKRISRRSSQSEEDPHAQHEEEQSLMFVFSIVGSAGGDCAVEICPLRPLADIVSVTIIHSLGLSSKESDAILRKSSRVKRLVCFSIFWS